MSNIVLSLYPNSRGMGYACIEKPAKLLDSGIITIKPPSNEKILKRVRKFVEYFKPTIVILRDFPKFTTYRGRRLEMLLHDIVKIAEEKKIPIHRYGRQQIRDVFEIAGASTKYEISQKLIEQFPILASRAPRVRKLWMDEDYNMGIFDAVSLAITHQYLTE